MKIAVWNANGLAKKSLELKTFMQMNDIDIMLITETHFTSKNYMNVPYYSVYTTNNPNGRAHGGTAIIVRNSIPHYPIDSVNSYKIQSTAIKIAGSTKKWVISAVYCPPNYSISSGEFTEFFQSLGTTFIAGGDYNAKHSWWGSRTVTPTPKGRNLYTSMQTNHLYPISTGEPTYWPADRTRLPDLLDFAIVKNFSPYLFSAETSLELTSDHTPIIIQARLFMDNSNLSHHFISKTDWNYFKEDLENSINCNIPLKTQEDIDLAIGSFYDKIRSATDAATTKVKVSKKRSTSIEIANIIAEKRRLRKIWQKTRTPEHKHKLNVVIKELRRKLRIEQQEGFERYLNNLSSTQINDYSLWKATKKIKRPQIFIPPIRREDGGWARDDSEKAATFARYYGEVFTPNPRTVTTDIEETIINKTLDPIQNLQINVKVSEVSALIQQINVKKSCGHDLISSKTVKQLPPKAIRFLTIIINAIFRVGYFPRLWKIALIVLINKPGKPPDQVTSYRPISLLPIFAKIIEKIIHSRLMPIIENKCIIPDFQFGFRARHGTTEQVNQVTSLIRRSLEDGSYCSAVFLDVAQAFDKVWHTGLLYKLKQIFPDNLYGLLESYLTNRGFQIKCRNSTSTIHPITAGIPQGSVLGPLLYIIFTYDIPKQAGVTVNTYADDTAILATDSNPISASNILQRYLITLQQWFATWRIKINENKSTHVTFTTHRGICPSVMINNRPIPQGDTVKYLGIHLDTKLNWRTHIWTKRKQLNLQFRKFYWLMGWNSKLSLNNKLTIYKSIFKPIWTYGIVLWCTAANSNIQIIERFQNKILRSIVRAPWYITNESIRKELGIPTIEETADAFLTRYKERLKNHPNSLATNLLVTSIKKSRFKKFKRNI